MTDSTTEAAPHNGVGHDERNKQRAVIELLVAGKISEKHPQKYLQCYRSATVGRITTGRWAKTVTASETGKAKFRGLPRAGHAQSR